MGGADGENGEGGARDRNSLQCLQGIGSTLGMKKKVWDLRALLFSFGLGYS